MGINIKIIIIISATCLRTYVFAVTKPSIEILPKSPTPYRLTVGDQLQLTCIYKSNDETVPVKPSNLVFYKDEAPIVDRFLTIRQHSGDTVTLVIYTKEDNGAEIADSGYYRCSYSEWQYQIRIQIIAISFTNDAEVLIGYNGHYVYYSTWKNLTLECSPSFPKSNISNQYSLKWFRKDKLLGQETKLSNNRVLAKGNQLIIVQADLEDIGEYQCVFTFQNKDTLNKTVWIKAPPVIMRNYFNQQDLEVGQTISIDCHARGFPRPNLFWTKDRVFLQSNDRIQITNEVGEAGRVSSTLQIINTTLTDHGVYHCNAESTVYQYGDDRPVTVSVYERATPEILSLKTALESEFNEWKISCNVSGYPFPDIYWFKDGQLIHHGGKYHIARYIPRFSILVISNVSVSEDQGMYGCFINSTGMMGTDYRTVTLQYYEPYYLAQNGSPGLTAVDFVLILMLFPLSYM